MLETVVTVILSAAVGAIGWFLVHFVWKYVAQFYDLRARIRETFYFHANVRSDTKEPYRSSTSDDLRRLAAQLEALQVSLPACVRIYIRCYDLSKAVGDLTCLFNSFTPDVELDPKEYKQLRVSIARCRPNLFATTRWRPDSRKYLATAEYNSSFRRI